MKRLEDEPFALLGVTAEDGRGPVAARLAEHAVNWRHALVPSRRHRIFTDYNVRAWPSIVVIDADGIIRRRVQGYRDLAAAIDDVLRPKR